MWKTPARFHTDLFCSLFRALRPLGSEKIANNFAPRDCLQKFAGFSHGLDPSPPFKIDPMNGRYARESGVDEWVTPWAVFPRGERSIKRSSRLAVRLDQGQEGQEPISPPDGRLPPAKGILGSRQRIRTAYAKSAATEPRKPCSASPSA